MSDLFREEAIEARQTRWAGEAADIKPISVWAVVGFIALMATAMVAFLFVGKYTKKERVSGVVLSSEGVVRLRTAEAAVISAVKVRDGQQVAEGEVLFELSRERYSDAGATAQLVDRSMEAQNAQALMQSRDQQSAMRAGEAALQERIRRAKRDLTFVEEELRLQSELIASQERTVASLKPLADERIVSELQYRQQQNQLLDQRSRLETLKRTREGLVAEARGAESDALALRARASADIAAVERSRLALEQDRLQRRTDTLTQVRAPVAGTVTAVVGAPGQRADPAVALATLVPSGARLQAMLFVPSNAVGFLRVGQRVALRYDAFPFEKFGQYAGTLVKISETDVPLADMELPIAVKEKSTLYRVRVELDRDSVQAYGEPVRLRPGLTLAADIELERRRLIDWIFDPLFALGMRL
jgi:membrane fusion protein